jgi:hypothetical protein
MKPNPICIAAFAEIDRHHRRQWTPLEQAFLAQLMSDYTMFAVQGFHSQPYRQGITGGKSRQGIQIDPIDYIHKKLEPGEPIDGLQRMVRGLGLANANIYSLEGARDGATLRRVFHRSREDRGPSPPGLDQRAAAPQPAPTRERNSRRQVGHILRICTAPLV